jgi:4-hydroxybenzoyl-CoA thioesterase
VPTGAREITLRFLAAPTDAGYSGDVSGGSVLEWIDKAGYACAVGWSGSYCVTAYVGDVRFTTPVRVGHLVEATGRLLHTGRSSMQVLVTVRSGDPSDRVLSNATSCLMVFVAVDGNGKAVSVPTWQPVDELDSQQEADVVGRMKVRGQIEDAMSTQSYTEAGTAPRICLRFLAAPTDINWGGKVHGGKVMRWIDEAAHVLSTQWLGTGSNIAVYAGGFRFYRPLRIGHLVEVEARLLHTGPKSLHISVHVRSGDPATGELALTTHCLIIFVRLDGGRAVPARQWSPVSEEDQALAAHARHLIELRSSLPPERPGS